MYPVSDEFKVAVRYSHQAISKCEVLRDGQTIGTIYPESGTVEIDSRRAKRRTCSITLHAGGQTLSDSPTYNTYASLNAAYSSYTAFKTAVNTYQDSQVITGYTTVVEDDGLVPGSGLDLLTPYGNELRLYRGIRYQKAQPYTYSALSAAYPTYQALEDAISSYQALANISVDVQTVEEYVSLGVFIMESVDIDANDEGVELKITGVDRGLRISDNRWIEPYQIASGTNVGTAILAILQDRWADIQTSFSATTATTAAATLGIDADNDPWADAIQIAESAGLELYFDADGICVLEPAVDTSVAAAVEYYNEDEEAMLLTASRRLSRDGVYNAVVVTGEGSDTATPYRSVAFDDNPASPTYVYGPYGTKPMFYSSPLINSQNSADRYALARLNEIRGTNEDISWTQICDPSLDATDVVAVVNVKAKIARAIVLDRLIIPLDASGTMSAQGRTIVYSVGDAIVTSSGESIATIAPDRTSSARSDYGSATEGNLIRIKSIPGVIS